MIPKSFIQDLLNRLDIVDVIERYLPLKKAGANFVACCPFHNEKSPSFTVSQSKQFYHCFGCGAHGTAIGFVMEHAGMGFVEAVEDLAKSVGMVVPQEASNVPQHKVAPDLYELMQTATRYYREQLKQSPRAIEYLKKRGLSGEVAAKFLYLSHMTLKQTVPSSVWIGLLLPSVQWWCLWETDSHYYTNTVGRRGISFYTVSYHIIYNNMR